jgi:hypothetical protein
VELDNNNLDECEMMWWWPGGLFKRIPNFSGGNEANHQNVH